MFFLTKKTAFKKKRFFFATLPVMVLPVENVESGIAAITVIIQGELLLLNLKGFVCGRFDAT